MAGFKKSGIYEFNRHLFNDSDFMASFATDNDVVTDRSLSPVRSDNISPQPAPNPVTAEYELEKDKASKNQDQSLDDNILEKIKPFTKAGERKSVTRENVHPPY
ncbi:hypothetical protein HHI36_010474 [Cryptolaemus montrouzieri]|uniref:Uncharacterized protein n=1 Tax=Cryptolaemus montrouzieri TaxID=559131 RepID=A0ABD2MIW8_9CUCU